MSSTIDSTGIKAGGEGEWHARKHRHMLPNRIPDQSGHIGSVTADEVAYEPQDTRKCHDAIAVRGAHPHIGTFAGA